MPGRVPFAAHDEAMTWFDAERHNLAALAQEHHDAALVVAVRGHLLLTGYHAELRTIARAALAGESGSRAAAMHTTLGFLDWRFGEHRSAVAHCEQAITAYRQEKLQAEESVSLNILAGVYHDIGDLDLARTNLAAAIELYVANDLRAQLIGGLGNLGLLELELGRLDSGEDALRRSVELAREIDDWQDVTNGLNNLGVVLSAQRRTEAAEEAFREALRLAERHRFRQIEMSAHVEYAELLISTGRFDEARDHAEQALELAGADDLFIEVDAGLVLAGVNRSVAEYDEVLRRATEAGFRIIEVRALAGKAALTQDKALYDKAIERAESAGLRYRADLIRKGMS